MPGDDSSKPPLMLLFAQWLSAFADDQTLTAAMVDRLRVPKTQRRVSWLQLLTTDPSLIQSVQSTEQSHVNDHDEGDQDDQPGHRDRSVLRNEPQNKPVARNE